MTPDWRITLEKGVISPVLMTALQSFSQAFNEWRLPKTKSQIDFLNPCRNRKAAITYTDFIRMAQVGQNFCNAAVKDSYFLHESISSTSFRQGIPP